MFSVVVCSCQTAWQFFNFYLVTLNFSEDDTSLLPDDASFFCSCLQILHQLTMQMIFFTLIEMKKGRMSGSMYISSSLKLFTIIINTWMLLIVHIRFSEEQCTSAMSAMVENIVLSYNWHCFGQQLYFISVVLSWTSRCGGTQVPQQTFNCGVRGRIGASVG